jgi:hypothetical protein
MTARFGGTASLNGSQEPDLPVNDSGMSKQHSGWIRLGLGETYQSVSY